MIDKKEKKENSNQHVHMKVVMRCIFANIPSMKTPLFSIIDQHCALFTMIFFVDSSKVSNTSNTEHAQSFQMIIIILNVKYVLIEDWLICTAFDCFDKCVLRIFFKASAEI
ncbi:hypothetical protein T10_10116 [Trichinella papuae]|uniref:Uncharacterized protein n=1 Tax=Trichinella papuae TaxID=268474 RepID=A0A0V1MEM0_9BILA|nr:hypothetical protein T10_10116 [Trichinella papuae]